MTEYSRMAKGNYTVSGGTLGVSAPSVRVINLPFKPDYVELINYTQAATPAQHGIPFAFWDASVPPLTFSAVNYDTVVEIFNATPVLTTDMVKVGGGISVFSAGLSQQYGPAQQVVASTKGTTTSFQVTGHGYSVGDTVIFRGLFQSATTGMPQMNWIPFTITTITDANNFIVDYNSNNAAYTNLSGSPASAFVLKVLYPFLYLPEDNVVTAITLGNTTTITTSMYHNFEVGQEIAFRIPNAWGTVELNSLPNVLIPGQPIYGYVVSITDNWTFVVNINSSAFTAFTTNIAVNLVPGLTFPQVLAVGDVNMGGQRIYTQGVDGFLTTSPLYPSPNFPTKTNRKPTINGPGISGAFVNNTSMGFIIGNFHSRTDTSSWVGGSDGDVIEWRAYLHDYSTP
jgi:hypothetical protein